MHSEDTIDFIAEHGKVINVGIGDSKLSLTLLAHKHIHECKGPWQYSFLDILHFLDGSHELLVGDQVIVTVRVLLLNVFLEHAFVLLAVETFAFFGSLLSLVQENLLLHNVLSLNHSHYDVEIAFSLLVSHEIVEDCAAKLNLCALLGKDTLNSFEHVEDIFWCHAAIVVIVTELKEQLKFPDVCCPGKQINCQNEVESIHPTVFHNGCLFF